MSEEFETIRIVCDNLDFAIAELSKYPDLVSQSINMDEDTNKFILEITIKKDKSKNGR